MKPQPVFHDLPSTNIQLPVNSKAEDKNIDQAGNIPTDRGERKASSEIKAAKDVHIAKKYIPHRKSLPREKDIFVRHGKGSGGDDSNIIDFPVAKQESHGIPSSAAALLDNNYLSSLNSFSSKDNNCSESANSATVNSHTSSFDTDSSLSAERTDYNYNQSSFLGVALSSDVLPKLNLTGERLSVTADKINTAGNVFSVPPLGALVMYGVDATLTSRQQFALPTFVHNPLQDKGEYGGPMLNNDQKHHRTDDKSKSDRHNKIDGDLKTNRSNFLAQDGMINYAKKKSNNRDRDFAIALVRSGSKAKMRGFDNKQNMGRGTLLNEYRINSSVLGRQTDAVTDHYVNIQNSPNHYNNRNAQGNSCINQNKTSLYYQAFAYPNEQRLHYRNSRSIYLPSNTSHRSAFYSGSNYPVAPCFRSYYS
jgi:hypothetical protein